MSSEQQHININGKIDKTVDNGLYYQCLNCKLKQVIEQKSDLRCSNKQCQSSYFLKIRREQVYHYYACR